MTIGLLVVAYAQTGQLVQYMCSYGLKHEFMTSYKTTVLVRRVADVQFALSDPTDYRTTNLTICERVLAFSVIASRDGKYLVPRDFDGRKVRMPSACCLSYLLINAGFSSVILASIDCENSYRTSRERRTRVELLLISKPQSRQTPFSSNAMAPLTVLSSAPASFAIHVVKYS